MVTCMQSTPDTILLLFQDNAINVPIQKSIEKSTGPWGWSHSAHGPVPSLEPKGWSHRPGPIGPCGPLTGPHNPRWGPSGTRNPWTQLKGTKEHQRAQLNSQNGPEKHRKGVDVGARECYQALVLCLHLMNSHITKWLPI